MKIQNLHSDELPLIASCDDRIAFSFGGGIFMKTIPLTQGKFAIVDDDDFERVILFKWRLHHKQREYLYAKANIKNTTKKTTILLHRLILNITDRKIQIDHKNGNGLDNQKHNLRTATNSQNQMNRRSKINHTSIYKGVYYVKKINMYSARITVNKKLLQLGTFKNETDAAIAYNDAATKYFGEYARLNFIKHDQRD